MTFHKTSKLTGVALDVAVLMALSVADQKTTRRGEREVGRFVYIDKLGARCKLERADAIFDFNSGEEVSHSIEWSRGGPVIEQEHISTTCDHSGVWIAYSMWNYADEKAFMQSGPTPLVAAMRCYVMSKLGAEVEIPKELK